MLASTAKLRPRYFLIVLALAGDSTITRFVLPLATGPFPPVVLVEEEARDLAVVVVREVVVFLVVVLLRVVPLVPVVPPVFLVVGIILPFGSFSIALSHKFCVARRTWRSQCIGQT